MARTLQKELFPLLLLLLILGACHPSAIESKSMSAAATTTPAAARPTADIFKKTAGGDPRTAGYWLLWNKCAENSKSQVAEANGGRAAGWILMDDLLEDPGILLGKLQVETCEEGIQLMQIPSPEEGNAEAVLVSDLVSQMLVAQLNMAAGAASCPAAEQAVQAGQLLLLSWNYEGPKTLLDLSDNQSELETAQVLIHELQQYNTGRYCR